ncbi:conjugal transfer protein TrbH [Robbsia sp. Bb-Pol-6]|uniref:Conjugal transfer protein TrbH n=1 Tax=Robbsia betulipollinis TaxID=2981849 RepID=A0ABT3ZJP5_9BURK|nr:conjugal transfer protein TrbH [Robbsia betulipollinis]MCY0386740.1 conjugal transfer protein TrbH [Robbsia betulipollinis]
MRGFVLNTVAVTALVGLAGCTVTQRPHGNHAAASSDANKTMADDTVTQLMVLYPPAHTRLDIQHPASDDYGRTLLSSLREKGYAILEYDPSPQSAGTDTVADAASLPLVPPVVPGVPLRYAVDAVEPMALYRVTLQIGAQSISRAFGITESGMPHPAGLWIRKEPGR